MDFIQTYGHFIKKTASSNPERALELIKFGLFYELNRLKKFPNKKVPKAYQKLSQMAISSIYEPLKNPQNSVWTNIFAPVEILQNFDLNPLSLECFASFTAGFRCEDMCIDHAEKSGIAETLCSYHKAFIGAGDSRILPKPLCSITTSMICDGNINTFRSLSTLYDIPLFILDIPYEYTKDSTHYVVTQLRELIHMLEDLTHQSFNLNLLKETLIRENASKAYYQAFLKAQVGKYYPSSMALQLFMLFPSHVSIGTQEALDFYKLLAEDIKKYPKTDILNILWVHLMPYQHDVLGSYFNFNPHYQIQTYDLNLDYMMPLDASNPLEALAKKMILNLYNGTFERKVEFITNLAKNLNVDAAINFCHWGCKQSSGAVNLLKEALAKDEIPMLILDGDALDHRNSHDGQIKTRLEAFLEMIEKQKGGNKDDRLCL